MTKGMKERRRVSRGLSSILYATGLTSGALLAMPAWGQDTEQVRADVQATPPSPSESEVDDSDVIVVTAQLRAERYSDVPATLSVISGDGLDRRGISSVTDLTTAVAGLRIDQGGAQTVPTLRGIGSLGTSIGNDPSVALYIDGVYQPNQAANTFDLPAIDRVEVLKGPQGTLYGRNATGGVIRILTREPSFTPEGEFLLSYGSYDEVIARASVSGPLVDDVLAARVSVAYLSQDGYNRDLPRGGYIGGKESIRVSGRLLFRPSDIVSLLLTASYLNSEDATFTGNALNGNSIGNAAGFLTPSEPWQVAEEFIPNLSNEQYSISGRLNVDLGFANLMSLTAYTKNSPYSVLQNDYSAIPALALVGGFPDRSFQQDVQLVSNSSGTLEWVLGGSYFTNSASYTPLSIGNPANIPTGTFNIFATVEAKAFAAFGELTYQPLPGLYLTGGLRYAWERKTVFGVAGTGLIDPPTVPERGTRAWDDVIFRGSVRYELNPRTSIYATYSEGFKSGTYNAPSVGSPPVNPETVSAYEIGLRSDGWGPLSGSISAFYYKYRDIQLTVNVNNIGQLQNATSATVKGIDVEAVLRPVSGLSFRAALSLLDATYDDFPNAIVLVPKFLNGLPNGNQNAVVDLSGARLVRAPTWTLSLNADYRHEFGAGTLDLNANMYHSDNLFYDSLNRVEQDAYTLFGAQIGWTPAGSRLRFAIWGRNLTNEPVLTSVFVNTAADGAAYAPPRQVGAQVSFSF